MPTRSAMTAARPPYILSLDANQFLARAARRSAHAGIGKDPALVRPLRLLHRDVSDLSPAWRRARFTARAHLPHQGHAGERQAGDKGHRQAYRPVSFVLVVHD